MLNSATLIWIGADRLFRLDSGANVVEEAAIPDAEDDLGLVAEVALNQGDSPKKRTFLLQSELWTQRVELPHQGMAKGSHEDLQQTLAIEAEAESSLSPFEAQLAFVPLPAHDNRPAYWVCEGTHESIDVIAQAVELSGSKFFGMAHPAGLPRLLSDGTEGLDLSKGWERIEIFPGLLVGQRHRPGEPVDLLLVDVDARNGEFPIEMIQWLEKSPQGIYRELLVGEGMPDLPGLETNQTFHLSDETSRHAWMTQWLAELTARHPKVPVVTPYRPSQWPLLRKVIAGGLATAVAFGCYWNYQSSSKVLDDLKGKVKEIEGPATALKNVQKQKKKLLEQQEELKEQTRLLEAKVEVAKKVLQAHRVRLARLMHTLAEKSPDSVLVQELDGDEGQVVVRGLALTSHSARDLAHVLETELTALGWKVRGTKQEHQDSLPANAWAFAITLEDERPKEFEKVRKINRGKDAIPFEPPAGFNAVKAVAKKKG